MQDAQEVGLVPSPANIPDECKEILGANNPEIINTLIYDLLDNSDTEEKGFISYSPDVEGALILLRSFSRIHIYENRKLTTEQPKIQHMFSTLFAACLEDIENEAREAKIFTDFIDTKGISGVYLQSATPAELVRDFIAGMTDRYFAKRFEECVIPRRIEGRFS
jgi:dGTPase